MTDLAQVWPQNQIRVDCLVGITLDLAAPFLSDLGLPMRNLASIRALLRKAIQNDAGLLHSSGIAESDKAGFVTRVDTLFHERFTSRVREDFVDWIRDTYTFVPADRPSWERYETFFHQWSVAFRHGANNVECFSDPSSVYADYCSFLSEKSLRTRLRQRRKRSLSRWDCEMFTLRNYSLEEDVDTDDKRDPLGFIEPTATRNYFQQFWEHLRTQLSEGELDGLWQAALDYYSVTSFCAKVIDPRLLTRFVR